MQLENIEDLLNIDHEKLKVAETKRILTRIKQLLKNGIVGKKNEPSSLPHKGISVVGNQLVHLEFDIESGEARISNIEVDSRDVKGRNIMAGSKALHVLEAYVKDQK